MADIQPHFRRRYLKRLLIGVVVVALAGLGIHLWFVYNAKGILKDIVAAKSNGKLKLELSKLDFDFINNRLEIREASLSSTDSTSQPVTYHVSFRGLALQVRSFWPLLLQNRLLLDSIQLNDPDITVMQWRRDTSARLAKDELSIPQEMGRLYNSMLDALEGFGIRRIVINNARLSLLNKMRPESEPVVISNIFFDLLRSPEQVEYRDEYIQDKQSIELRTTDQNIAMPGGRHRLSFKKFHLELFSKRIQLDSCTITARATENSKSSYKIFFNKLMLVGVDFGAMYRRNLIKADSVYCENPLFNINLSRTDAVTERERPDPQKIIRELSGDLDLAFVGVKDAGIHIEIAGEKARSLFNSNKDDFEMRGLRINADSSTPVLVDRFDMLVRDYRLYNEDSSVAYGFDSIRFVNNKVVLNNFSVVTTATGINVNHNQRDFKIPYFELTGLDWYQLIFEQNLEAQEAVLYKPVIRYAKRKTSNERRKVNLFTSLQGLDRLMTLNKVDIIDGQMNLNFGRGTSVSLNNVDLSVYSNRVLESTNREGLRRAVDLLSFSDGVIKIKDIEVALDNVRYTGNNLVHAQQLEIRSRNKNITAHVNDVNINNLLIDERTESLLLDGLQWKNATVFIQTFPSGNRKGRGDAGSINLRNISGTNTHLRFGNDETAVTTFVQSLKIDSIYKDERRPVQVEGFTMKGNDLSIKSESMQAEAADYQIAGSGPSYITGVRMNMMKEGDSLLIHSPRIDFNTRINSILNKNIEILNVQLQQPVIRRDRWPTKAINENNNKKSIVRFGQITANEPDITINIHRDDSLALIRIPRSLNSSLKISGLVISDSLEVGSLALNASRAIFVQPGWENIGVEEGKVSLKVSDIRLSRKKGEPSWSALIDELSLENPNSLSLGKNKVQLLLNEVSAGNLRLSSDYIGNFGDLLKYNVSAWLRTTTGQYIDSITTIKWYNAGYDYANRTLSLDSFTYHPTQPRDSVIARSPFQTDYITFRSGPVQLAGFDLQKYSKDSALIAESVNVTKPVFTIYRDKLPPFRSGAIKHLPVNRIKNISLPVAIDRINIEDGLLNYTEKNAKSRAEGTLLFTNIYGSLSNIKNRNLQEDDSLSLALNAYLMDSALLNLRVKESYTDSLSGFLMSLRLRPTKLSLLNPVLAPLSNVVIRSGTIDSLQLRAIGNENISLGEMNMYYKNLRIQLVKSGHKDSSSLSRKFISFLANTFIIRKNNNGRTGLVYFERLRDRSFFNYIVKMTFSGMATSIGLRSNKKYLKQYKNTLKERNLPPIDFE